MNFHERCINKHLIEKQRGSFRSNIAPPTMYRVQCDIHLWDHYSSSRYLAHMHRRLWVTSAQRVCSKVLLSWVGHDIWGPHEEIHQMFRIGTRIGSPREVLVSVCRHLRYYKNERNSQTLPGKVIIGPGDSGSYTVLPARAHGPKFTVSFLQLQHCTLQQMVRIWSQLSKVGEFRAQGKLDSRSFNISQKRLHL